MRPVKWAYMRLSVPRRTTGNVKSKCFEVDVKNIYKFQPTSTNNFQWGRQYFVKRNKNTSYQRATIVCLPRMNNVSFIY